MSENGQTTNNKKQTKTLLPAKKCTTPTYEQKLFEVGNVWNTKPNKPNIMPLEGEGRLGAYDYTKQSFVNLTFTYLQKELLRIRRNFISYRQDKRNTTI